MAEKTEDLVEQDESIETTKKAKKAVTLESAIEKEFGKDILVNGNYIINQDKIVIPVSPSIDSILGGVPEGSFFTFTGPPKCGKSSTSLHFAATAQDPKYGGKYCPEGRHVYYYNIEGRLKKRDLEGIPHLNKDRFHIIQSQPGKILHAADYMQIADQFIHEKIGSIHIIDSYSALCTELEQTGGMADMQRADGAKVLAKFCRKVCNVVPVNNCIVIGITHQGANVSGYGAAYLEKSGMAIAYQCDVKLKCRSFKPWKLSDQGSQIGQEIEWEAVTTALNVPPGQRCTSYLRYSQGIDVTRELLNLAIDLGIIKKGGAWYTFPMLNDEKAQGLEQCCELVKNHNGLYDKIYTEVKNMLGLL